MTVSLLVAIAPNTMPFLAMYKAAPMTWNPAHQTGTIVKALYVEGIAWTERLMSARPKGPNIFVGRKGQTLTPPLGQSVAAGITVECVIAWRGYWLAPW